MGVGGEEGRGTTGVVVGGDEGVGAKHSKYAGLRRSMLSVMSTIDVQSKKFISSFKDLVRTIVWVL